MFLSVLSTDGWDLERRKENGSGKLLTEEMVPGSRFCVLSSWAGLREPGFAGVRWNATEQVGQKCSGTSQLD